ncbi:hypothetical protein NXX35_17585 [Bacteroides xylanisolvens]|nr:hypothetical protein NXX35_17585 [Bacteroides xylanisolvens]
MAEFRDLFCRHIVTVERDDVLIRVQTVSQPFLGVSSRDGAVGQLLLHVVCFHRFSCIRCFPESSDSVAIDISRINSNICRILILPDTSDNPLYVVIEIFSILIIDMNVSRVNIDTLQRTAFHVE